MSTHGTIRYQKAQRVKPGEGRHAKKQWEEKQERLKAEREARKAKREQKKADGEEGDTDNSDDEEDPQPGDENPDDADKEEDKEEKEVLLGFGGSPSVYATLCRSGPRTLASRTSLCGLLGCLSAVCRL